MPSPKNISTPPESISYLDYVAMFCSTDAEWSRRRVPWQQRKKVFLSDRQREFATPCCVYGDNIRRHHKSFLDAHTDMPQYVAGMTSPLADYLYNPAHYTPFGHADDLYFALFDDFDPIHRITAEISTSVVDMSLAFCPSLDSLEINQGEGSPFLELHTLFSKKPTEIKKHHARYNKAYDPVQQPFQEKTPLLIQTSYKLSGLAAIGESLLFQQTLFQTMADTIKDVIDNLKPANIPNTKISLIESADIINTRIAFLDMQGIEEVGTLILTNNFTVGAAIISALRNLQFTDVFKKSPILEQSLRNSDAHTKLELLAKQESKANWAPGKIDSLGPNHVFRWTHSLHAASPEAFLNPDNANCNGLVKAQSELKLSPGHRQAALSTLDKLKSKSNIPESTSNELCDWHMMQENTGDSTCHHEYKKDIWITPLDNLVTIKSAMKTTRDLFYHFGTIRNDNDHGRDIVDIWTSLSIPFPSVNVSRDNNGKAKSVNLTYATTNLGHITFSSALQKIRDGLFNWNGLSATKLKSDYGESAGSLDLGRLHKKLRSLGLPAPLRRTIEYLYQNYGILLADPFLFDIVLDIYDAFATLYMVLTKHLPESQAKACPNSFRPVENWITNAISEYVEALQDALSRRIAKDNPSTRSRDMAIDFRGGLNQIILAADAPMKCGVGLLRHYVWTDRYNQRDTVGIPNMIGIAPGASCSYLPLPSSQNAVLAYFTMDVPHVLHPPSHGDFFHEVFHILYNVEFDATYDCPKITADMRERTSEVFSELLCAKFLFESNPDLFVISRCCRMSQSTQSARENDERTILQIGNDMFKLFLVWIALSATSDDSPDNCEPENINITWEAESWKIPETASIFQDFLRKYGKYSADYASFVDQGREHIVLAHCKRVCIKLFAETRNWVRLAIKWSIHLQKQFYKGAAHPESSEILNRLEAMQKAGRPMIKSLNLHSKHPDDITATPTEHIPEKKGNDPRLDLLIICSSLSHYFKDIYNIDDKSIHLNRIGENLTVNYTKSAAPWFPFQLDRGSAAMFCPIPKARGERLRKYIAILKTYWDIASHLRSRRLNIIIDSATIKSENTLHKTPKKK